jgi:ketosteroid isomerase-like protein
LSGLETGQQSPPAQFRCRRGANVGSLVDKKQFLAQTARPVTISGLSVQEVRVRILGDVAIIHARTSYTATDGEQRNGRYTDVWARWDGKWLAVSAHVTR